MTTARVDIQSEVPQSARISIGGEPVTGSLAAYQLTHRVGETPVLLLEHVAGAITIAVDAKVEHTYVVQTHRLLGVDLPDVEGRGATPQEAVREALAALLKEGDHAG